MVPAAGLDGHVVNAEVLKNVVGCSRSWAAEDAGVTSSVDLGVPIPSPLHCGMQTQQWGQLSAEGVVGMSHSVRIHLWNTLTKVVPQWSVGCTKLATTAREWMSSFHPPFKAKIHWVSYY